MSAQTTEGLRRVTLKPLRPSGAPPLLRRGGWFCLPLGASLLPRFITSRIDKFTIFSASDRDGIRQCLPCGVGEMSA